MYTIDLCLKYILHSWYLFTFVGIFWDPIFLRHMVVWLNDCTISKITFFYASFPPGKVTCDLLLTHNNKKIFMGLTSLLGGIDVFHRKWCFFFTRTALWGSFFCMCKYTICINKGSKLDMNDIPERHLIWLRTFFFFLDSEPRFGNLAQRIFLDFRLTYLLILVCYLPIFQLGHQTATLIWLMQSQRWLSTSESYLLTQRGRGQQQMSTFCLPENIEIWTGIFQEIDL